MSEPYLAHYGIKGMRWGVRRSLAQLGRALKGSPGKGSSAKKQDVPPKPKPKSISEMSDTELKARLDRIRMEQQYKDYLSSMNPKKESMVKRVAMKVLEQGLTTLGNKAIERIGQNLMEKSKEKEPSLSELMKKGPEKLNTKEMQRLNSYFIAKNALDKNLSTIKQEQEDKRRRQNHEHGGGI